ncbi:hypothetical protein ABGV42_01970 [Paenibacillus pabuli]|uniref:hypothetical protein n=1 Tax=Paenibacillus pabuli TaxID=1472 RepID=UPI003242D74F
MLRQQLNSLIRIKYVKLLSGTDGINGYVFADWAKCNKFLEQIFGKHLHKRVNVGIFSKGVMKPINLKSISYQDSVLEINEFIIKCSEYDEELKSYPVIVWYSDESVFVSFLIKDKELLSIKFPDKV